MKIAVIGSGISGLLSAYLLGEEHRITLYEAGNYIGGHTRTVKIELAGKIQTVDLGFLVYNEPHYPNFIKLLSKLGVHSQTCPAVCSFRNDRTRLEFCDRSFAGLFGSSKNFFSPAVYAILGTLPRFHRDAVRLLEAKDLSTTLRDFLAAHSYGDDFRDNYLFPLLSAIGSLEPSDPLKTLAWHVFNVLKTYGFLTLSGRAPWRVIRGGSFRYIGKITSRFPQGIRLNTPVVGLRRELERVLLKTQNGEEEAFDHVVVATHADQALGLLTDPTDAEHEILGGFPYRKNTVVLHTDNSMLPKGRKNAAAWNCYTPKAEKIPSTFTWNLSVLQQIESPETLCLTMNPSLAIDPSKIIGQTEYTYPVLTWKGLSVQRRQGEVSGPKRTHYVGSYWGHGTHEDAVRSVLSMAEAFGKHL